MAAPRTAAVATTRSAVAPAVSATSRCASTTRATASIASPDIVPQAAIARPRRVKERCWTTGSRRSPATSATSSRVVFDPMSMQAQRMAVAAKLAIMGRR